MRPPLARTGALDKRGRSSSQTLTDAFFRLHPEQADARCSSDDDTGESEADWVDGEDNGGTAIWVDVEKDPKYFKPVTLSGTNHTRELDGYSCGEAVDTPDDYPDYPNYRYYSVYCYVGAQGVGVSSFMPKAADQQKTLEAMERFELAAIITAGVK